MDHFNLLILWFQVIMTMHIPGIVIGKVGCGGGGGESGWVGLKAKDFLKEYLKPNVHFQGGGVG